MSPEAIRSSKQDLSGLTIEELDDLYIDMEQQLEKRKKTMLDSLNGLTGRKEIKGQVDPETLGVRTKTLLEAVDVDLENSPQISYKVSYTRGLGYTISLEWDAKDRKETDQLQATLSSTGFLSIASISFSEGRLYQFSATPGRVWNPEVEGKELERHYGDNGRKIFEVASKPFSRLAIIEELILVATANPAV